MRKITYEQQMSRWDDVSERYEHRVTFSETDGLGFVHHRCVAVWFEQARENFFRRFGVAAVELYRRRWFMAIRQLNVRYDSFLAYDDQISVRVALTKLGRVSCDFHYRIDNLTTGKLAVRGHTNVVAVDGGVNGDIPRLGRFRFDRSPFEAVLVDADDFFDAEQGAWRPPRWDPESPVTLSGAT